MQQRIRYLDVAKGLLMVMVIFHHSFIYNRESVQDMDIDKLWAVQNLWVSFFMPAFFIITGLCSNFDRKFGSFFWRNFKGIMIPCWFFTFFSLMRLPHINLTGAFHDILVLGGGWWFLSALFFAKLLYWAIRKYIPNKYAQLVTLLALAFLSTVLKQLETFTDYYYHLEVMNLTVYLWVGERFHSYLQCSKVGIVSVAMFLATTAITLYFLPTVPRVTASFDCTPAQYPVYLLLSLSGSFGFLFICRLIHHNFVWEYFGRGSLLVFVTHFYFVVTMMNLVKDSLLSHGFAGSMIIWTSAIVMSVLFTMALIWVFNQKYLRWTLGKF